LGFNFKHFYNFRRTNVSLLTSTKAGKIASERALISLCIVYFDGLSNIVIASHVVCDVSDASAVLPPSPCILDFSVSHKSKNKGLGCIKRCNRLYNTVVVVRQEEQVSIHGDLFLVLICKLNSGGYLFAESSRKIGAAKSSSYITAQSN
jgi:hypothetical protein